MGYARLPGPIEHVWSWQQHGLCRDLDAEAFFHPEGERGVPRQRRAAAAKEICLACPVLRQCRSHALRVREPYGIWGGLTEQEREAVYAGELAVSA
ncbi:MAG TPA: WhiB family transcriptional regulator [Dermatophilaceae bacterium]|nr:WhiB family transcriptional regulator [Dermatophilaceae bacterium]